MQDPVSFLLNRHAPRQVVEAPAFSLTKVLAVAAALVAPLTTVLTEWLADADIKTVHYVSLALGLLGFLAVTAAADVLARGIATAATKNAEGITKAATRNADAATAAAAKNAQAFADQAKTAQAGLAQLMRFSKPLDAHRRVSGGTAHGADVPIKLLALANGSKPFFLALEDNDVKWLRENEVSIPERN